MYPIVYLFNYRSPVTNKTIVHVWFAVKCSHFPLFKFAMMIRPLEGSKSSLVGNYYHPLHQGRPFFLPKKTSWENQPYLHPYQCTNTSVHTHMLYNENVPETLTMWRWIFGRPSSISKWWLERYVFDMSSGPTNGSLFYFKHLCIFTLRSGSQRWFVGEKWPRGHGQEKMSNASWQVSNMCRWQTGTQWLEVLCFF